jgi:hypothetical protein
VTQQPQYPQYPQQYPPQQQPAYPQYPQPQQQPAQQFQYPQGYPQQGWPQMPPMAPPVPQVPLAEGTLDDFFNQPSAGGGPAVSWKGKPDGWAIGGIVARAIGKGDVQQQTDPQTKQPKFFRDGRPQFVMKIPLRVQPTQEFPEGEAQLYVRGQLRDELVRAMTEAGAPANAAPEEGAGIYVALVGRKPSRGFGNPSNVFQVQYTRPGNAQNGAAATSPASVPQQAPQPQQYQQPVQQAPQYQQPVQQAPQYQQPQTFQQWDTENAQAYAQQPPPDQWQQAPGQGQVPGFPPQQAPAQYPQPQNPNPQPQNTYPPQQQFQQQPAPQQVPQGQPQQQPNQPQPPQDLTPDQQALLARLTSGGA